MPEWLFREKAPNEKARNPMGEEFFASNSDAAALIREAIQNSLDARLSRHAPVHIRVSFVDLQPEQWSEWLGDSLWTHLHAEDSGISREVGKPGYGCRALVLEDFNTTGLTGNMRCDVHSEGERNAFFHFFRAEGISDKTETERGSWGIGKIVFPRTSRIRTFFALTCRSDDGKTVLAGQCILKYHRVNGKYYAPDGWFGLQDSDGFLMPVEEPNVLSRFMADFKLARNGDQPGLSVVILYPDEEVTLSRLAEAMVSEYYYPVLSGDLIADFKDGETFLRIDSKQIDYVVRKLRLPAIEQQIRLSRKHLGSAEPDIVLNMYRGNRPEWQEEILDEIAKEKIRRLLDKGDPVEIRVPMKAAKKTGEVHETFISVVLLRSTGPAQRPVFLRNGLIISQAGGQKTRGALAAVIIDDDGASNLLGKAENPAHTNWLANSERFRATYMYPADHISFVKNAPARILEVLIAEDEKPEADVLAKFFSLPAEGNKGPEPTGAGSTEPPPPPPDPRDKPYDLRPSPRGFVITGRKGAAKKMFIIRAAYDRLRGNPFSKWSPFDFRIEELETELSGINKARMACNGNRVAFIPDADSFTLRVSGFDPNRDLRVDVQVKEPGK